MKNQKLLLQLCASFRLHAVDPLMLSFQYIVPLLFQLSPNCACIIGIVAVWSWSFVQVLEMSSFKLKKEEEDAFDKLNIDAAAPYDLWGMLWAETKAKEETHVWTFGFSVEWKWIINHIWEEKKTEKRCQLHRVHTARGSAKNGGRLHSASLLTV